MLLNVDTSLQVAMGCTFANLSLSILGCVVRAVGRSSTVVQQLFMVYASYLIASRWIVLISTRNGRIRTTHRLFSFFVDATNASAGGNDHPLFFSPRQKQGFCFRAATEFGPFLYFPSTLLALGSSATSVTLSLLATAH